MSKELKYGFTTGSCAAAAAKAAAYMIFTQSTVEHIELFTPGNIVYDAELTDIRIEKYRASCAVVKNGGDDPDVTSGAHIYATVTVSGDTSDEETSDEIICGRAAAYNGGSIVVNIDGGQGVGRVTKAGLDQPVGSAAINHVPREMIESAVIDVAKAFDYSGQIDVLISIPEGEELAKKTMNSKLGIEGGLSILGTSGIVWPMSTQAIVDTIKVEARQRKALGQTILAVSPGNYGLDYMKQSYGYDLEKSVKCSNFIGDTIDIAVELGFEGMLITGHIGKLVKLAGGMMNTHSREGDCRMELLATAGLRCGLSAKRAVEILSAVTTEEGIRILDEENLTKQTMKNLMESICFYADKRAQGNIRIEFILYSNKYGELAKSDGADDMLKLLL